jgi:hypothetical protein
LQQPYNDQIMTPHQLYEWAEWSIHHVNYDFVTKNEYKEGLLSSWFATAETVHGPQQLPAYMPVKKGILNIKIYSVPPNCTENHVFSVLKDMNELKDITGFVTCIMIIVYDNSW